MIRQWYPLKIGFIPASFCQICSRVHSILYFVAALTPLTRCRFDASFVVAHNTPDTKIYKGRPGMSTDFSARTYPHKWRNLFTYNRLEHTPNQNCQKMLEKPEPKVSQLKPLQFFLSPKPLVHRHDAQFFQKTAIW